MKTAKGFILILLILVFLLCGCTQEPAPPPPANFTGTVEGYEYYHENERDKLWEEDIITIAQLYLTKHPWMVDDTTKQIEMESYVSSYSYDWVNQYIPEKRELFLTGINEMIPHIPEYSDNTILWEVQKVFALLDDCHAVITPTCDEFFPMQFYPFYEDGEMTIVTVGLPASLEHLLYSRLTAIHGVPIAEVLEKMRPYSSIPLEDGFLYEAIWDINSTPLLIQPYLYQTIGLVDENSLTAEFTFVTESGETVTETISAISQEQLDSMEYISHSITHQFGYSFATWGEEYLWMEYNEEESLLYVRIYAFRDDEDEPMLQMVSTLQKLITKAESIDKMILDLRCNPGGHAPDGYSALVRLMGHEKIEQAYILINEGSFSMSALAVYNARCEVPGILVVGAPSGQELPCGTSSGSKPDTPNHSIRCSIPGAYVVAEDENAPDRIVPDILIYPTLKDYKNGVDTVLEAVLNME